MGFFLLWKKSRKQIMQFHFHHSPLSYLKISFLGSLLFLSLSRLKIGNPNLMPTSAPNKLYLVRVAPEILFHVWIPMINFYVIESFQPMKILNHEEFPLAGWQGWHLQGTSESVDMKTQNSPGQVLSVSLVHHPEHFLHPHVGADAATVYGVVPRSNVFRGR